jgi:hypothetical protein
MEVALISVDWWLRHVTDDMRLMRHPAKQWEIDYKHGEVRTCEHLGASAELVKEALAELDALHRTAPVKPYQRFEVASAGVVAGG